MPILIPLHNRHYKTDGFAGGLLFISVRQSATPGLVWAVLGKNIWGPGPSSFGRQQGISEITIEPITLTIEQSAINI